MAANRSESFNGGSSELMSRCTLKPCQSGFANMISIAAHEATIISQLTHVGTEYRRRCICGWETTSGSFGCRTASLFKKEGNASPECEGDIDDGPARSCETAGMRGCSRNFLGANALCPELSLSFVEVLMIVSQSRHVIEQTKIEVGPYRTQFRRPPASNVSHCDGLHCPTSTRSRRSRNVGSPVNDQGNL